MGTGVGMRDPARQLARVHGHAAHVGKHGNRIQIARLLFQDAVVDRAAIDARRRAGLQAPLRQGQFLQALPQGDSGRIAGTAARIVLQAHVNQAIQERTRSQHHGLGAELQTDLGNGTDHAIALHHQVFDRLLEQPEVWLVFQAATDSLAVQHPISLSARSANCWPLRSIEDAELNPRFIRRQGHRATQGVDFFDKVALADPANGGIARHLA